MQHENLSTEAPWMGTPKMPGAKTQADWSKEPEIWGTTPGTKTINVRKKPRTGEAENEFENDCAGGMVR